jgi:hypothetical protein
MKKIIGICFVCLLMVGVAFAETHIESKTCKNWFNFMQKYKLIDRGIDFKNSAPFVLKANPSLTSPQEIWDFGKEGHYSIVTKMTDNKDKTCTLDFFIV